MIAPFFDELSKTYKSPTFRKVDVPDGRRYCTSL